MRKKFHARKVERIQFVINEEGKVMMTMLKICPMCKKKYLGNPDLTGTIRCPRCGMISIPKAGAGIRRRRKT